MVLIVFQSGKLKYNHPYVIILYLLSQKFMAKESFLQFMIPFFIESAQGPLTHWGQDKIDDVFKCNFLNENIWIR